MLQKLEETFFSEIRQIVESQDFAEIETEVDSSETIVGEMTVLEKALRTISARQIERACCELKLSAKQFFAEKPNLKILTQARDMALRGKAVADSANDLMWIFIKDRLDLWKPECIGIRKGFQIVTFDEKEE